MKTKLLVAVPAMLLYVSVALSQPGHFKQLLEQAQMVFEMPENFNEVKVIAAVKPQYQYALEHTSGNLEVRYAIYLLNEAKNNTPPEYRSVLENTLLTISDEKSPEILQFGSDLLEQFNAAWGATAVVGVNKEFGRGYSYCRIVALHRDTVANAYYFYLANTEEETFDLAMQAFTSLRFKQDK